MRKNFILICICFAVQSVAVAKLEKPVNFREAKKIVYKIFADNPKTLYCGCFYNTNRKIAHESCSMKPTQSLERANRTEIEHMMPMQNLVKQFECGRRALCIDSKGKRFGGRKCCQKTNPKFRLVESELYNLWPTVGSVNQARGSYRFGEFSPESKPSQTSFDGCAIIIDRKTAVVEPRDEAKGIVARANLFMAGKYNVKLSKSQRSLLEYWNQSFPPQAWEKKWARQIARIQGYENSYIESWNKSVG